MTEDVMPHTSLFSKGCDVADINKDGRSDLFTVDTSGSTHYLANLFALDYARHAHLIDKADPYVSMRNFLHVNAGSPATDSNSDTNLAAHRPTPTT